LDRNGPLSPQSKMAISELTLSISQEFNSGPAWIPSSGSAESVRREAARSGMKRNPAEAFSRPCHAVPDMASLQT